MPTPFHTSRLVEFSDTDMAGIMHFSAFFRYMEAAEHQLLRDLGFSVYSEIDGVPVSFPRVAANCEFQAPAKCEDVLEIEATVERLGTKSVTYGFKFSHDRRLVATGQMTSVCCRIRHGEAPESIPIPTVLAEKLQALL